jgi:hypothetical protein
MSAPSALISVQDGSSPAVNLATGASLYVTPGNTQTIALQSSVGVQSASFTATINNGVANSTFTGPIYGPVWSVTIPTVNTPCTIQLSVSVTDGNNDYSVSNTLFAIPNANWVAMSSTTVAAESTPTSVFVAGALLTARGSGIFLVTLDVGWSSGTTADSVTWSLITDTSASGKLSAGTAAHAVRHGICGKGTNATTVASGVQADAATIDTADNMTYNAAAWNTAAITQYTETMPTLTGLLTGSAQSFTFSGIVANAATTGTTKTPFAQGNTVGFGISVTASHTITIPALNLSVVELPIG